MNLLNPGGMVSSSASNLFIRVGGDFAEGVDFLIQLTELVCYR